MQNKCRDCNYTWIGKTERNCPNCKSSNYISLEKVHNGKVKPILIKSLVISLTMAATVLFVILRNGHPQEPTNERNTNTIIVSYDKPIALKGEDVIGTINIPDELSSLDAYIYPEWSGLDVNAFDIQSNKVYMKNEGKPYFVVNTKLLNAGKYTINGKLEGSYSDGKVVSYSFQTPLLTVKNPLVLSEHTDNKSLEEEYKSMNQEDAPNYELQQTDKLKEDTAEMEDERDQETEAEIDEIRRNQNETSDNRLSYCDVIYYNGNSYLHNVTNKTPTCRECKKYRGVKRELCTKRIIDKQIEDAVREFKKNTNSTVVKNLRYTVLVNFKVNYIGNVYGVEVVKKAKDKRLNIQAAWIIEQLPKFVPGRYKNKNVGGSFTVPVKF